MSELATVTADAYHADELADVPCLSASIAHILWTRSPLHAWTAHPKLNPNWQRVEDPKFDVGNVVHKMLLEGEDIVTVVNAPDWRTNAAKAAREYARAEGRVALLDKELGNVAAMYDAICAQLNAHEADPPLFQDGAAEQTLIWQEGDVTCKARLDWLRSDLATIDDLKTTSRSASPDAYSRALFGVGGDVQAAMYLRGVQTLMGVQPTFRWVVCETAPPYAMSVITPAPAVLELGFAKVEWAINKWRECLAKDEWPGYPTDVQRAECPPWELDRWLAREVAA